MTRKHFVAIAEAFAHQMQWASSDVERETITRLAKEQARVLAHFNSSFNRSRFLTACGVTA